MSDPHRYPLRATATASSRFGDNADPHPTKPPVDLRLRTVAKPDKDVAILLAHLGLRLPQGSKLVQM